MDDLLESAPGGFLSITDGGMIIRANGTLHHWLGYQPQALIGQSINIVLSVAGRIFYQTHIFPLLRLKQQAEEVFLSLRTQGGESFPVIANLLRRERANRLEIDAIVLPMRQRERYEAALLATTRAETVARANLERAQVQLQQLNAQLTILSTVDPLTGLKNRRAFYDVLSIEHTLQKRMHTSLALMLLDVDHFKQVNDTYGHAEGDRVLQQIALVLGRNVRQYDILARFGGEEFVLLLPNTSIDEALILGERLRTCVAAETSVTISVGVAVLAAGTETECNVLEQADRALYASKRNGRNRVTAYDAIADIQVEDSGL